MSDTINFDFADLPETAFGGGGEEPALVNTLAALVHAAPRPLSLVEIISVAVKSGIEMPAKSTVRSYMNRAAADGRVSKPSRQTYGKAGEASVADEDAVADEDPVADADPLADLA